MASIPINAGEERIITFAPEQICAVLADVPASPHWWPASVKPNVLSPTPGILGSELRVHPRGGRPFRCRVAALEPPRRMRMRYDNGFIVGTGEWRLTRARGGTRLTYELEVVTEGWLVAVPGRFLPLGRMHSRFRADIIAALEREMRKRQA